MSQCSYVKNFQDLIVYKKSVELSDRIFQLSCSFPKQEAYSLTDQIRRSSRSVGAQIAEAWAKRRYPKHFISKLTDADGEQLETRHWLTICQRCKYLNEETVKTLLGELNEIGRMLNSVMGKAESFCQTDNRCLREDEAIYLCNIY